MTGSFADGATLAGSTHAVDDAEPTLARRGAAPLWRVGVVVVLLALGVANIAMRARWHEVEDGVLWGARAEGVTAARGRAGLGRRPRPASQRGDVLLAVNGVAGRDAGRRRRVPAPRPRRARGWRTRLSASAIAAGARRRRWRRRRGRGSMYFVLAAVGLFTLLVGASVRLRRPRDQATLHFFWLCVAFFGAFTFSFNGPFDRLDWVFYWGDAVAMALLPPLLLHFTLVFPERPPWRASSRDGAAAAARCMCRRSCSALRAHRRRRRAARPTAALFSRALDLLDRAEPVYLFAVRVAARRRAGAGLRRDHVADRTPPAALDCLGHGARRRAVRVRLRAAVGARHRTRRSRCS